MRRLICGGLIQRTALVCRVTEISDIAITDIMALIITQLLNYNLSSEIKERKLQRSYFQDNAPEHVLANENKLEEMKRIYDVQTGLFLNRMPFRVFCDKSATLQVHSSPFPSCTWFNS